ncbi:hypothetical protein ACIQBJ_14640 [Kitasatospora sp. NPDC088391]|uniref:hypothetical protein n=1 Tax=Kitasatospora sp. NPDC088391 TaxID=3364074 RepID=UPI00380F482A
MSEQHPPTGSASDPAPRAPASRARKAGEGLVVALLGAVGFAAFLAMDAAGLRIILLGAVSVLAVLGVLAATVLALTQHDGPGR